MQRLKNGGQTKRHHTTGLKLFQITVKLSRNVQASICINLFVRLFYVYTTHSIDGISHSEHVESLLSQLASVFLHESHDESSVVIIVIISVHHLYTVLRVGPEGV